MSRIWAFVLAVAPIALLFFLPIRSIAEVDADAELHFGYADIKIFELYKRIFTAVGSGETYKLFGFLPLFYGGRILERAFSLAFYAILVGAALNVVLMIIALCSGKKAPKMVCAISLVNLFTFGTYLAALIFRSYYLNTSFDFLTMGMYTLYGIVGVSLLLYIFYALANTKKAAFVNLALMLLTVCFTAAYVYPYFFKEGVHATIYAAQFSGEHVLFDFLSESIIITDALLVFIAFTILNVLICAIRLSTVKGLGLDIARSVLSLVVAAFIIAVAFLSPSLKTLPFANFGLYAIIACGIALVHLIFACIVKHSRKKKAQKVALEEAPTCEEEEDDIIVEIVPEEEESVVEPIAAESMPEEDQVANAPVEMPTIQEPVETPAPAPAPQNSGYDYYNSKNFDPFIATLSDVERQEFTELFILKYRGDLAKLPDYVIGGDNLHFFRKVFIYLGQYREQISSALLGKMYQFLSSKQ